MSSGLFKELGKGRSKGTPHLFLICLIFYDTILLVRLWVSYHKL